MLILTRNEITAKVAERWQNQYRKSDGTWINNFSNKREIYKKLVALGNNPNPEDVDRIIGNTSWTVLKCEECKQLCDIIAVMGEHTQLCFKCLEKARKKLMDKARE